MVGFREEAELVKKLKQGNDQAYRTVLSQYGSMLLGYVTKLVGNRSEAEEVVQEAIVSIFEASNDLKDAVAFAVGCCESYTTSRSIIFDMCHGLLKCPLSMTTLLMLFLINVDAGKNLSIFGKIQSKIRSEPVNSYRSFRHKWRPSPTTSNRSSCCEKFINSRPQRSVTP